MFGLEDEDIENTIRMKGWAWVLARRGWVYAGEPDFIYRQIREVIIALPGPTLMTHSFTLPFVDPKRIEAALSVRAVLGPRAGSRGGWASFARPFTTSRGSDATDCATGRGRRRATGPA